jgi:alkylhydroperoxidase/carboxymuconolactone decarboxylase family protein YurZ
VTDEERFVTSIIPRTAQIVDGMRVAMGSVPPAIEKASSADLLMVAEQLRSSAFAMPPQGGALDAETRTLIYLAVALASSNHACIVAMTNKARVQVIASEKILEASHIARYAMATRVIGAAEPIYDLINERRGE